MVELVAQVDGVHVIAFEIYKLYSIRQLEQNYLTQVRGIEADQRT